MHFASALSSSIHRHFWSVSECEFLQANIPLNRNFAHIGWDWPVGAIVEFTKVWPVYNDFKAQPRKGHNSQVRCDAGRERESTHLALFALPFSTTCCIVAHNDTLNNKIKKMLINENSPALRMIHFCLGNRLAYGKGTHHGRKNWSRSFECSAMGWEWDEAHEEAENHP